MDKELELIAGLALETQSKIVLLVFDGLGDIPSPGLDGKTPLEAASKPNLTDLAARSSLGLLDPILPGITPGSGPGHLGLFGYEPTRYNIGRGVLEGLGIGFTFTDDDVASRFNFATMDADGNITDRRAGRIPTQEAAKLCEVLQAKIPEIDGVKITIRPVKEHRGVAVFRGKGLGGNLPDTDPQRTGVRQLEPKGLDEESEKTAALAGKFIAAAMETLKGRSSANTLLMRGFSKYTPLPSFRDLYKLKACAIATYPMYRGLASLAGMEIVRAGDTMEDEAKALAGAWNDFTFFFVHVKKTDSYGEDGNLEGKVRVIEEGDRILLPAINKLSPDALAVTGDHSTPCMLKSHSWHPVPLLIHSAAAIPSSDGPLDFGERHCSRGTLGRLKSRYLLPLLLSHAGKLAKFGA
ncbi:MAG: 2,3-bisphosphoglycerate-independent phosphoglycerate mutase [Pseudomonadota bacterium]